MATKMTYYRGKNGMDYMTQRDAEVYGEGCEGFFVVEPPTLQKVAPLLEPVVPATGAPATVGQVPAVTLPQTNEPPQTETVRDALIAKAKGLGIKAAHLLNDERLVEKITDAEAALAA